MADPLILDELEKKSEEMLVLQHDLTTRLSSSQQIIADFALELEKIKEQIASKEGVERFLPGDMGALQQALVEKQDLIKSLIDDIGGLRLALDKKDEHLREFKAKLTEKIGLLTENEAKVVDLKQELLDAKREIVKLKNDVSIYDSRFVEGDAQNKKILTELMKTKDDLQKASLELVSVRSALSEQRANMKSVVDKLQEDNAATTRQIINESIRRNVGLSAELKRLQKIVEAQRGIIELKERKETELAHDMLSRVKEMIALKGSVSQESLNEERRDLDLQYEDVKAAYAEEEEDVLDSLQTLVGRANMQSAENIPQLDDLCPMIEIAFDHGDSKEEIIRSLKSGGYRRSDIDEAFRKVGR